VKEREGGKRKKEGEWAKRGVGRRSARGGQWGDLEK